MLGLNYSINVPDEKAGKDCGDSSFARKPHNLIARVVQPRCCGKPCWLCLAKLPFGKLVHKILRETLSETAKGLRISQPHP